MLETPRLILRPPAAEDIDGFIAFHGDPVTMEHLGGPLHPADAWRQLAMMIGCWTLCPAAMFSVIEKTSGAWVGRIGPWTPMDWPVREVGWGVLRRFEGQGYALEAAVASLDFVFDELGWDHVDHLIADTNTRSQQLAHRLGAAPGELQQMPGALAKWPVRAWGQSRQAWAARRGSFAARVPTA